MIKTTTTTHNHDVFQVRHFQSQLSTIFIEMHLHASWLWQSQIHSSVSASVDWFDSNFHTRFCASSEQAVERGLERERIQIPNARQHEHEHETSGNELSNDRTIGDKHRQTRCQQQNEFDRTDTGTGTSHHGRNINETWKVTDVNQPTNQPMNQPTNEPIHCGSGSIHESIRSRTI
jgi:hypothetical protein